MVATGGDEGEDLEWIALRRDVTAAARVVFPGESEHVKLL